MSAPRARTPIRALCFDLFDTLVDLGRGDPGAALRSSMIALHAEVSAHLEIDLESFGRQLREADRALRESREEGSEISTEERFAHLLEQLGVAHPTLHERLTEVHMGLLRDQVHVPRHHAEVLREMRRRAPVALCSNFTHAPTARGILDDAGLTSWLDPIVISVEVGLRKPRRELFQAVVEGLGVAPEETLHVGDNLKADVAGAREAGLRTAWITRRVPYPARALGENPGPPPDYVISDLAEILPLLAD